MAYAHIYVCPGVLHMSLCGKTNTSHAMSKPTKRCQRRISQIPAGIQPENHSMYPVCLLPSGWKAEGRKGGGRKKRGEGCTKYRSHYRCRCRCRCRYRVWCFASNCGFSFALGFGFGSAFSVGLTPNPDFRPF